MVTLDWSVIPRGARDAAVSVTALDMRGAERWTRRGLPIVGRLQDAPSTATKQYWLQAYAPSQGTHTESRLMEVFVHDKPPVGPPAPPMGVAAVAFFNCADSHQAIHIWLNDLTAGTGWVEKGVLDSQFDPTGSCPALGRPFVVSLLAGHQYQLVTVDVTKCQGQNDPTNIDCQRTITSTVGATNGPTVAVTVV